MSTIDGIPAHVLLIHAIVVLAPLTAILAIICALWKPARQRLVWPVLALAAITMILTPITTEAGEWLEERTPSSEALRTHTELGDWMIYLSAGLLLVAVALAALHIAESRSRSASATAESTSGGRLNIARIAVAILAVVIGVGSVIGVYRIGDAGAKAVWGDAELTLQTPDE